MTNKIKDENYSNRVLHCKENKQILETNTHRVSEQEKIRDKNLQSVETCDLLVDKK